MLACAVRICCSRSQRSSFRRGAIVPLGEELFPRRHRCHPRRQGFNFYDDLIKDKIFVVSFLFTTCRDVCPLATARLAELQEKLGDSMGRDIFFYSLSIDPETDTPERLKEYAKTFGAGPGWLFLTGKPEDIHVIRHKLGERSKVLSDHRNDILLGNGTTGQWARFPRRHGALHHRARPDGCEQVEARARYRAWRQNHRLGIDGPPGEALFARMCAACHTVGKGDRVGPDLDGITERRQRYWLVKFIANPQRMRASKTRSRLPSWRNTPTYACRPWASRPTMPRICSPTSTIANPRCARSSRLLP